jgi:hypothetical protein
LNRSRSDALHGGFSGLARGPVKRSAQTGMQKNMQKIKLSIESFWGRARNGKVAGLRMISVGQKSYWCE